ncbi:ParB/RepB/Spo0J family partition protein [Parvularcula marina]|uniref:ParB/RepB/Spo0J family partition protein n=1 Tax=Parvularcula marina TaxID=2292771 RepID=A0A371RIZ3_9PROT|nr:ParB/RepB/Spo0J family partition protein [Parvularcula marina]RFB05423.1 ParB/RepB/Spo0J family partition protein [Parvularcula marina]
MAAARKGLGRGLESIFADEGGDEPLAPREGPATISLADIAPDPDQPRKSFTDKELDELAASIKARGLLQPILIRPVEGGKAKYLIIAGERRWRASARAKLHEIPVIIRNTDPGQTAEIALIENIQRTDLNAIEEADAYTRMKEVFGRKPQEIADAVGKSRSHVANMMRLSALPADVRAHVVEGKLSMGHARALLSAADPAKLAEDVIRRGLSVRETELLVGTGKNFSGGKNKGDDKGPKAPRKTDADTKSLENDLEAALGLTVEIDHGKKGGTVTLAYDTLEQLDDICRRLMGTAV